MKPIFLVFSLSLFAMVSCVNVLQTVQENPTCKTRLVGEYDYIDQVGFTGASQLILKNLDKGFEVKGEFGEITDEGVYFSQQDPTDPSKLLSPIFRKKDSILFYFDKASGKMYGDAERWGIQKENKNKFSDLILRVVKYDSVRNELISGSGFDIPLKKGTFAFCIEPGSYMITSLVFSNPSLGQNTSREVPKLTFNVLPGKTNSLGKISQSLLAIDSVSYVIPSKPTKRPQDHTTVYMGGAIAALALEIERELIKVDHFVSFAPYSGSNDVHQSWRIVETREDFYKAVATNRPKPKFQTNSNSSIGKW